MSTAELRNGLPSHHQGRPPPGSMAAFNTVILWFRRDLRVSDNPALIAAVQAATTVVRDAAY